MLTDIIHYNPIRSKVKYPILKCSMIKSIISSQSVLFSARENNQQDAQSPYTSQHIKRIRSCKSYVDISSSFGNNNKAHGDHIIQNRQALHNRQLQNKITDKKQNFPQNTNNSGNIYKLMKQNNELNMELKQKQEDLNMVEIDIINLQDKYIRLLEIVHQCSQSHVSILTASKVKVNRSKICARSREIKDQMSVFQRMDKCGSKVQKKQK